MKLTIIDDVKKLTIEEALKDNYFMLRLIGTGLNGTQLYRLTPEDIIRYIENDNENIVFVRVD